MLPTSLTMWIFIFHTFDKLGPEGNGLSMENFRKWTISSSSDHTTTRTISDGLVTTDQKPFACVNAPQSEQIVYRQVCDRRSNKASLNTEVQIPANARIRAWKNITFTLNTWLIHRYRYTWYKLICNLCFSWRKYQYYASIYTKMVTLVP